MFRKAKPSIIVTIPSPCHENWNEMLLVERGRYCQACQTVVTDFSALSDDEIIRHIEQSAGGKMCGRFLTTQTERALLPEIKVHRISTFRKVAASVLLFYASVNEAMAMNPKPVHYVYADGNAKKPAVDSTVHIRGKVLDFTGAAISNLELQIKGTDSTSVTDSKGNFKFHLPGTCVGESMVIITTHKGKMMLDSLGAVLDTKVNIVDTFPYKKAITLYLYPVDTLKEVDVVAQFRREIVSIQGALVCQIPTPIPKPRTPWQKFNDFFKPKKHIKVLMLLLGFFCFAASAQNSNLGPKLIQKLTSQAEFPGGDSAMNVFLQKNIQYPQMERDNDIQGKVILHFIVDTIGALTDIKVIKTVSPGLDKEALRVVKLMPKWIPAMYHKKPVPVYYTLPIKFYLQEETRVTK